MSLFRKIDASGFHRKISNFTKSNLQKLITLVLCHPPRMEMRVMAGSAAVCVCVCVCLSVWEFMFPEHDCQPRTKLAPAAENFLSCEDSLSSVLNAAPWLWSSPSLLPHPNYLALFIIQRLCWRQALRFQKENCFATKKWKKKKKKKKKAGLLQCNPLSYEQSWNSI